jgi:GTP cyclohydrolase II
MQSSFDEIFEKLSKRTHVPLRADKAFDPTLTAAIDTLAVPDAVKAGLHLLNDDLGRAHELAQAHEGDKTCDYWHAIVHRREGDFDNAKYWLHRAGRHPVLSRVHDGGPAAAVLFVDRCRDASETDRAALETIQKREMLGLVAYARGPENAA